MKLRKKILSSFLALVMVLGMLPGAALAADYDTAPTVAVTTGHGASSDQIKIGATLTATAAAGAITTTLVYEWQSSTDGSSGWSATASNADSTTYTVAAADVGKYLRVQVTASGTDSGTVQSVASTQVPYTINIAKSGDTGTDDAYFGTTTTMTTYAASGNVNIGYVLDNSGTKSNGITYTGGTVAPVAAAGSGTSSYTVDNDDATNGVISLTATFAHEDLPTIIYVDAAATGTADGLSPVNAVTTLEAAYGKIPTNAAANEIRVLSNLDAAASTVAFNAAKTVTISSYTDATTEAPDSGFVLAGKHALFTISAGNVTLKHITVQGGNFGYNAAPGMVQVTVGTLNIAEGAKLTGAKYTVHGTLGSTPNDCGGGALRIVGATAIVNMSGGEISDSAAPFAGGVLINTSGTFNLSGGEIKGNAAVHPTESWGGGGVYLYTGGKFNMTGGKIFGNTAQGLGGGVVLYTATSVANISGGEISGNTSKASSGIAFLNGTLSFSKNPIVKDNKASGEENNLHLASGKTVAISAPMAAGAYIGINTKVPPTDIAPVAVATNAVADDAKYFHADTPTTAGMRIGTSGGSELNTTLYLATDARATVNTDVTLADDGKATITIDPTDPGMHYAVLGKNGAVIPVPVTGGTKAGETNWYTADATGKMSFGGLDPAGAPYQVVTSGDSTTAPTGNSGTTSNTKAGDKVTFTYVSASGNDTSGTGTKPNPYLTIEKAVSTVGVYASTNETGVIILLTDLVRTSNYNASTDGRKVTITSETTRRTVTHVNNGTSSMWHLPDSSKDEVTLSNIIMDGTGRTVGDYGEFFIGSGSKLTLGDGAVLQNFTPRAVNIRAGGTVVMLPGSSIKDCTAGYNKKYTNDNYNGTDGVGAAVYVCPTGTFDMRGGMITENKAPGYTGKTDATGSETTGTVPGGVAGVFGEQGASLKMSGTPVVNGNTGVAGVAANVYLNDADATLGGGQTITLTGNMEPGANVCVYVKNMPSAAGQKVDVATNATSADAAYFHSDKASQAGIAFEGSKVILSYDARAVVNAKVDKDGMGQLTVVTKVGTQYFINAEDGTVPTGVVAYDRNGDVVAPQLNGWYQTADGPLTFKPLELAKKYQVCSKTPTQSGNTNWGAGSVVEIPVVGENTYAKPGTGVDDGKTTIVIDPADPKIKYAVLDDQGNVVVIPGADAKGWVTGTGDKIVVELPGLPAGKEYTIVGVPIDDNTTEPADKSDSGATVIAPDAAIKEVGTDDSGKNITRVPGTPAGRDKITVTPTVTTQDYGVYNPKTGETEWKAGTGTDVVFDNLDPDVDYQVVTRTKDTDGTTGGDQPSMPTQGVTVPKNPSLDSVSGKTETNSTPTLDDDATLTINPIDPALDYGIVDKDGNAVPAPNGAWKPGTGGAINFPDLKPGDGYIIVTKPKADATPATPADANGGLPVIAPVAPVAKPDKDGNSTGATSATREPNAGSTDKITIPAAEATSDYKYAIRDKDGKYYAEDGTPSDTPVYVTGKSPAEDIVFNPLPMGKDYEIVKLPTAVPNPAGAVQLPSITPVPKLPPVVGENDITTGMERDGDAFITVNPTDVDYNYLLTDPTGKVLQILPGNDGSITFPNLMPGMDYKVITEKKSPATGVVPGGQVNTDRATDVETPVLKDGAITAGKDKTDPDKTQIVISPTSSEVKYVITDSDDKVVGVKTGNGGELIFGGLDPNKEYTISTVPKDSATPIEGATGYTPPGPSVTVKTPTTGTSDIPGANPTLTPSSGSITINPTVLGKVYEVIDPATGEVVGTVTGPIGGGSVTIGGLTAGKEYIVQVRDDVANALPVILGKVTTSGGSTGGGSGSSSNATVNKPTGGTVTLNPTNPKAGDKVTITVKPGEGFTTDKVTVKTTPGGKEIELTDNGDGTYTYTQPKEKVTIDATFKKVTGDPNSNGVSDLLNTVDHMAYLKGNNAGSFAPAADMTRGEVAQMFYNLLKNKDNNLGNKASFSDVSADAWYATAVNTLANIGIVEGVGEGSFAPERTITRAEFVVIATRFAAETTGSKTYTDVAASDWAAEAIGAASYYGWIAGYTDGTFKPTASITRSEAVKVVNAMLGRSADKAFIDKAEGLKTFPDVPKTDWAYYEIAEATNTHDYAKKDGAESWTK